MFAIDFNSMAALAFYNYLLMICYFCFDLHN
mgnify:CR=1 FL=1